MKSIKSSGVFGKQLFERPFKIFRKFVFCWKRLILVGAVDHSAEVRALDPDNLGQLGLRYVEIKQESVDRRVF